MIEFWPDWSTREVAAVIFQAKGHKKLHEFFFVKNGLNMKEYNFWSRKNTLNKKAIWASLNPISRAK